MNENFQLLDLLCEDEINPPIIFATGQWCMGKTTLLKTWMHHRIDQGKKPSVMYCDCNRLPVIAFYSRLPAISTTDMQEYFWKHIYSEMDPAFWQSFLPAVKKGYLILVIDHLDTVFMANPKFDRFFLNYLRKTFDFTSEKTKTKIIIPLRKEYFTTDEEMMRLFDRYLSNPHGRRLFRIIGIDGFTNEPKPDPNLDRLPPGTIVVSSPFEK